MENEKWYVGDMDKQLCNRLVKTADNGSFLVRIGTTMDRFVVTVNDNGQIGPYQVKITSDGLLEWREMKFTDIDTVIRHIRENPFIGLSGKMVQIQAPASGGGFHPSTLERLRAGRNGPARSVGSAAQSAQNTAAQPTHKNPPPLDEATEQKVAPSASKTNEEDYVLYQTLFEYKNDDPDDLNFDAGEILQVTDEGEGDGERWMEGRTQDGKFGSFPSTYVRKLNLKAGVSKSVENYGS